MQWTKHPHDMYLRLSGCVVFHFFQVGVREFTHYITLRFLVLEERLKACYQLHQFSWYWL